MAINVGSTVQAISEKSGFHRLPNLRKKDLDSSRRDVIDISQVNPNQRTHLMDRLARTAAVSTAGRGIGQCLRFVRQSLEKFDLGNKTRSATAISSVEKFRKNDHLYEVMNVTRDTLHRLPPGSIVITANPRGGAGHAQIMLGNGKAASDFIHGLAVYRGATKFYAFIPKKGFDGESHSILAAEYGSLVDTKWGKIYSSKEDIPTITKFIELYTKKEGQEEKKDLNDQKREEVVSRFKQQLQLYTPLSNTQNKQSSSPSMTRVSMSASEASDKPTKNDAVVLDALTQLGQAARENKKKGANT